MSYTQVLRILRREYPKFVEPSVTTIAKEGNPFAVLVSTVLSLRTRDENTRKAFNELWTFAKTPEALARMPVKKIEQAIKPAGFYPTKAKWLKQIASELVEHHGSKVPNSIEELVKFKGVGRKVANLVVSLGYQQPAICVDVHVHVLANRLGWVKTNHPDKTEFALRASLPKRYWRELNDLMVAYGQNVCKTNYPKCGSCKLVQFCSYEGKNLKRK